MKPIFLIPFFALGLLLMSCNTSDVVVEPPIDEPLVGGDRDEHGCIGSAGYMWCEPKQKCLRMWKEECFDTTEEAIAFSFSIKYEIDMTDIDVDVQQETADHARGMVKLGDEGGLFLAAETNGMWAIAHDGNGAISCKDLEQYDFPAEMIEDCADF
ncbi:hypothetical protein KKC44_05990 [Patescibacteria group bacterium]|nr:hypothetical protein [Patescibacteria group bacterium]MBU2260123.1 hypothetical protein [Patescibacteria group bacterium]